MLPWFLLSTRFFFANRFKAKVGGGNALFKKIPFMEYALELAVTHIGSAYFHQELGSLVVEILYKMIMEYALELAVTHIIPYRTSLCSMM